MRRARSRGDAGSPGGQPAQGSSRENARQDSHQREHAMPTRVICPVCGKPNRLEGTSAGGTIICLACGARIAVEDQARYAVTEAEQAAEWSGEAPPAPSDEDGLANAAAAASPR